MRAVRVLVLYNKPVLPANHPDAASEREVLHAVDAVSTALVQAGFKVSRLGMGHDPAALIAGLRAEKPTVVFNLFEGTGDDANTETYVAGLLEWLDIPFTGSPSRTLVVARNKHWTKSLLRGAGLPTPDALVVDGLPIADFSLNWPVIVKPATQDASVGLDQGSVVTNLTSLEKRVALLLESYGPPVLVEEFINGRELNVALIEVPDLVTLPISEILFTDKDPEYWPIVTYDAKWAPESRDFQATPSRHPANVSPRLARRVTALARQAFRLLGCRDYARVDFRVRSSGKPYILEINPNPDLSPAAGFTGGVTSAGIMYAQFIVDLVKTALARRGQPAANSTAGPKGLCSILPGSEKPFPVGSEL
jgi:D-alanine-D-alanine ligase